jgi:hypothetical protein
MPRMWMRALFAPRSDPEPSPHIMHVLDLDLRPTAVYEDY